MQPPEIPESHTAIIERLQRELVMARERASVAEEQLQRVQLAVRAFKQSQSNAKARREELLSSARAHAEELVRKARVEAVQASTAPPTSIYGTWAVSDPTLDERLDEYLQSEFEPDRSRQWMLSEESIAADS